jgi:hypothetical protein
VYTLCRHMVSLSRVHLGLQVAAVPELARPQNFVHLGLSTWRSVGGKFARAAWTQLHGRKSLQITGYVLRSL